MGYWSDDQYGRAYNLMSRFRLAVINSAKKSKFKTIRMKFLANLLTSKNTQARKL
ncbi:hypothetical protein HMPREF1322_0869 [Porphyromonas gingivalis W50]|nr:hypothetical protein HMPREF1322_0869 [Porphyromonas gingivalis W50]